jgi:hypothetical protein
MSKSSESIMKYRRKRKKYNQYQPKIFNGYLQWRRMRNGEKLNRERRISISIMAYHRKHQHQYNGEMALWRIINI